MPLTCTEFTVFSSPSVWQRLSVWAKKFYYIFFSFPSLAKLISSTHINQTHSIFFASSVATFQCLCIRDDTVWHFSVPLLNPQHFPCPHCLVVKEQLGASKEARGSLAREDDTAGAAGDRRQPHCTSSSGHLRTYSMTGWEARGGSDSRTL